MSSPILPDIPSFRKQHLFLEFASLKLRCPEGIYLSLYPGDPSSWSGVFFVRTGPYSPAVLRFDVSLPSQYPDLPPLVTFVTDIFHPLLVPLTTYTFSTSAGDANETVSARDEERLPPGGFSLRDGFPQWFGRRGRLARERIGSDDHRHAIGDRSRAGSSGGSAEPSSASPAGSRAAHSLSTQETNARPAAIVDVLAYIKSTFENSAMLDKLSLEASGNPGAWHAWRSYRGLSKSPIRAMIPANDEQSNSQIGGSHALPGDWNWEGVWENRVRSGIESSSSDPSLYGPKGGRKGDKRTEMIRFSKMDDEQLNEIRERVTTLHTTSNKV